MCLNIGCNRSENYRSVTHSVCISDVSLFSVCFAGKYCDVIRGELSDDGTYCTGQTIEVYNDGKAHIQFSKGKSATLAFHHMSKIGLRKSLESIAA